MSQRILIVDDEEDLVETLEFNFEREGFATVTARSGKDALERLAEKPRPDLVVLDLMLPDISGTEVCREMRSDPEMREIPVLMLTAKGDEIDRVVGFEVGTDDYMTKPFSVRELILRVRAILRRAQPAETPSAELEFGVLRVDPEGHRAWVEGEALTLTALEFRLLLTLLRRKGRVQTRERLLDDVWGIQADVTTRTVDTHVKRLRQKLGAAASYIETLRGVGYRFSEEP